MADASAENTTDTSIPVPTSVSDAAQALIAQGQFRPTAPYPPLDDHAAWREWIGKQDEMLAGIYASRGVAPDVAVEDRHFDGVPVYVVTPTGLAADDRRVYFDIHGGGLVLGGGDLCRMVAGTLAPRFGARVWSVDYRMPPEHPYPAPLDDCVTAYRGLLEEYRPEEIVVGGASAGGNLVAAMLLRARDEGLPLPAGAVLMTPEADLTESGDSFETNMGLDPLLTQRLLPANLLYAGGHDLTDPYLSPLFGDLGSVDGKPGFPPTFLSTGTRDLFLSNTVLFHAALRRAGVPADLYVIEAAGHGGFLGMAPEDADLNREIKTFINRCWSAS
jgi:acetyl esterase/lipase